MTTSQTTVITKLDAARIRALRKSFVGGGRGVAGLPELIAKVTDEATIVPSRDVPPTVVTVNSVVSYLDVPRGEVQMVTLAYPADVSIPERRISVLSPLGRALLGRSVGHTAMLEQSDGKLREIRVMRIHYQPEASGEFNL
jgi:regulator of nucleoside diphosphate kinase